MAKKLFYVCAGVFLLSATTAKAQLVWSFDQHDNSSAPVTMGISQINPASLIHGTLPRAGPYDQIAVEQHVLHPGDMVPLPMYPDGSTAAESEIFWTVHLWNANFSKDFCAFPARYITGDNCSVGFNGRQYVGGSGVMENTDDCGSGVHGVQAHDVDVLVTVFAARASIPVPVKSGSVGQLKAKYRR